MQKVITVSLNGNAYQLDEAAYAQLAAYLNDAARALANNPDRAEIIADLEQAIAEKCAAYLNAHKNVVTAAELAQVIERMGQVDDAAPASGPNVHSGSRPGSAPGADTPSADAAAGPAPRRLYQISEGAMVSGVCNGLAAYFNVDVTLVRVIFVVFTLCTVGLGVLAYVALMLLIPYASTSEEHAAAHGLPFNARALVERAKAKYAEFAGNAERHMAGTTWRREWRRVRDEWRAQRRAYHRGGYSPPGPPPPPPPAGPAPVHYIAHLFTGAILTVIGLLLALFTVAWLLGLISLIKTGAILGIGIPHGMPLWVAILILVLLFQFVVWPISHARRSLYGSAGTYYASWAAAWNSLISLTVVGVLVWYGLHHQAEVRAVFDQFMQWWEGILGSHTSVNT